MGFIATDNNAIYGTGSTEADAIAAAHEWIDNPEDLDVYPASAALLERVERTGGDIAWYHINGAAVTVEEASDCSHTTPQHAREDAPMYDDDERPCLACGVGGCHCDEDPLDSMGDIG